LVAAVKHITKENDRQGSPLMGKLASDERYRAVPVRRSDALERDHDIVQTQ
jgi:hypothetical protein